MSQVQSQLDLRAVVIPEPIIEKFLQIEADVLRSGNLSWVPYDKNWWRCGSVMHFPVASNGAGQFLVGLFYATQKNLKAIVYPKNTFEGIKNTYRLLEAYGIKTIQYDMGFTNTKLPTPKQLKDDWGLDTDEVLLVATNIGGIRQDWDTSDYPNVMLDGAHAQYLEFEYEEAYDSVVFSMFATKSTPVGEGGVIATSNQELADFIIRTQMYDKPNFKFMSLNVRVSTATAEKMKFLFESDLARAYFETPRQLIWQRYAEICDNLEVDYVEPDRGMANGYKFIITDKRITDLKELYTSKVFETEHNMCPATYPQLAQTLDILAYRFETILKENLELNDPQ